MRPSVFLLNLGVILFLVHSSSAVLSCYGCSGERCDKSQLKKCIEDQTWCMTILKVPDVNEKSPLRDCTTDKKKVELSNLNDPNYIFCNTDGCNKPSNDGNGSSTSLRSSIWMWPVTTLLAVGYLSYF